MPNAKPPPGDKNAGLDPDICLYEKEKVDNTKEGEEA